MLVLLLYQPLPHIIRKEALLLIIFYLVNICMYITGSIKLMAAEVGYELVTLVGFLDAILIRKDLIQDLCVPSLARFSNRVEFIHSCVMEPERVGKWVEYGTMVATNDVSKARYAATEQILLMNFATSGAGGSPTCLGFI
jgi:hypothetical protein